MNGASTVESLFFAALEKENAAEQAAFLEWAFGGNAELRRQVQKMLKAHPKVGDFLNKPVGEQLAAALKPSDATQAMNVSTDREEPSLEPSEGEGSANDEEADDLHFLSPSTDPYSLGRIGHYEVLEIIGKGGFGIVLRAFDEALQRVIALKVLAPALAANSSAASGSCAKRVRPRTFAMRTSSRCMPSRNSRCRTWLWSSSPAKPSSSDSTAPARCKCPRS